MFGSPVELNHLSTPDLERTVWKSMRNPDRHAGIERAFKALDILAARYGVASRELSQYTSKHGNPNNGDANRNQNNGQNHNQNRQQQGGRRN